MIFSLALFGMSLFLTACMEDDFEADIMDCPAVVEHYPTEEAAPEEGVSVDTDIWVEFNIDMDGESIDDSSLIVHADGERIAGTITYSDKIATFTPANYLPDYAEITVTVTIDVLADCQRFMPAEDYTWSFTSASIDYLTPPTLIDTDPEDGETNVFVDRVVHAFFDKDLDPESIDESIFVLRHNGTDVPGSVTYADREAVFAPDEYLQEFTTFTAHILPGIADLRGNVSENEYTWSFTSGSADDVVPPQIIETSPVHGEVNVVRNRKLYAVFSKDIDPATIHDGSIVLLKGDEEITGTVSFEDRVLHFMPMNYLESNTEYTARVVAGAADFIGNVMEDDYEWTFTTSDIIETIPWSVDLGLAENFVIFSAKSINNIQGVTEVTGDVGLYPGNVDNITGFPPGIIDGEEYAISPFPLPGFEGLPEQLMAIKADVSAAYLFASTAWQPFPISLSGNQAGETLAPGVYDLSSDLIVNNGDLVLDAQGDPHTFWIFRIGGDLDINAGNIVLQNGAQPRNIFWQVSNSAQIGSNTDFYGTILANHDITMESQASIIGRLFVRNGHVTLVNQNIVTIPED